MIIRLEKLSKRFETRSRSVIALEGIDLEVASGELFVLLGPSGSGKSTLLNLIAGLERPFSGRILFDRQPVADPARKLHLPPRERNVAMVFQTYALYPHLSVFDNIAFPLKVAKEPDQEDRVKAAAGMLKIQDLLSARPAELSGGQRQRVAIARAVVRRPRVLLLDEPLSNLDAQLRTSTRLELKTLQEDLGLTTIYVTHDQQEAMSLGQRVAVLDKGRLIQVAPPEELYLHPADEFVASFIGSPPMNLVVASFVSGNKGPLLRLAGQDLPWPGPPRPDLAPGTDFRLGIRPEDLLLNPAEDENLLRLPGRILARENLGREVLLKLQAGSEEFLALTGSKDFQEGDRLTLGLDPAKLHFFPLSQAKY